VVALALVRGQPPRSDDVVIPLPAARKDTVQHA
jgi:hypothetical protein